MSKQGWVETLITAQGDGGAVGNTGATLSMLPAAARYTLPANYFSEPGKAIRIRASGKISAAVAGPTLKIDVCFGTIASPIIVFTSNANALVARGTTNVTFDLDIILTCRTIGSGTSATMLGTGKLTSECVLGSVSGASTIMSMPLTSPAAGTGFDSTITNVVDLQATWGTVSASNTLTLNQFTLESLN